MRRGSWAVGLVLVLATAAASQTPDSASADTTTAIPLSPVRVTVFRTPLVLSEAPYAVTVERPAGAGPGLTMAEALGQVPGLQVDNRYSFALGDRISVRGLGARSQFGVRGVKVLVDGIPATMADGQTSLSHVDPRAIERVEAVRGPASSLWGNAAGGVLQLETASAPTSGGAGEATVLAGGNGLLHVTGAGGWGDERFGVRVSASALSYGGFRDHAAADKRFVTARAEWRGDRGRVAVVGHGVTYDAANPGSLTAAAVEEDPTQANAFNVTQGTGERADQGQVGVTWQRSLGGGGGADAGPLLDVSAWALGRSLSNPIPPAIIDLDRVAAGLRASVRGSLPVGGRAASLVGGVDADGQWDDRLNYANEAGDRGGLLLDQAETVTSVAPFVEAVVPIGGAVRAMAGLRWDAYRFAADDRLVEGATPDDSGERTMGQLSPSLGLTVDVGGASVYGNVASSFETPTTTELVNRPGGDAGFNLEIEPQRAWSAEAGARARLGGRVSMHGAVYRIWIRDALIPFEVPAQPGRSFFRNAGSAIHQGVELDATIAFGGGLAARVGWALVDARFDAFETEDADHSGNRVPGVAPHEVRGSLGWASQGGGRIELAGRWVDEIPVDDANTATAAAYAILDFRAASSRMTLGGVSLEAFGGIDNALSAAHVTAVTVNAFGGRYYEPGPGRAAYVGVRVGLR